jgi:hypothetical protein
MKSETNQVANGQIRSLSSLARDDSRLISPNPLKVRNFLIGVDKISAPIHLTSFSSSDSWEKGGLVGKKIPFERENAGIPTISPYYSESGSNFSGNHSVLDDDDLQSVLLLRDFSQNPQDRDSCFNSKLDDLDDDILDEIKFNSLL